MNLLETIQQAQGGQLVGRLAQNFGLDQAQVSAALENLVPMVAGGVQRNVNQQGGLDSIINVLQGGNHDQYLNDHAQLNQSNAVDDGNSILGQIFGSKDVSRQVAAHAATNSGIDAGILRKMLPVVASVVMGAMKQRAGGVGGLSNVQPGLGGSAQSSLGGLLTSFLDSNKDGSVVDDVLGMFLKR